MLAKRHVTDQKLDVLISELSEHIDRLETKRLQLLFQREEPIDRQALEALVGKDSPTAQELLSVLGELSRAPGLLDVVLSGRASIDTGVQLAAAVRNVSTQSLISQAELLESWAVGSNRKELASLLRRWTRSQNANEKKTPA